MRWHWNKILVFTIASALIFCNVLGVPLLLSTIGSNFMGELCPGSVTFICNALNFGTNGFIAWYINNARIGRYLYNEYHEFPQNVTVDSSILNASVQIYSARLTNDQFSFENFTLTLDLYNLLPLQGQSISCGTSMDRSDAIIIKFFNILDENIHNLSYVAKYHGVEGELVEVYVQWVDVFILCDIITYYKVQLLSSQNELATRLLTTIDCEKRFCSVHFNSSDMHIPSENYYINIMSSNKWIKDNSTFSTTIRNTTGNSIDINTCNKTASITCSTYINEICIMNLTDSASPVALTPGQKFTVSLDVVPQDIRITIYDNLNTLTQTLTYEDKELQGILNVSYMAIYEGTDGELAEINIHWRDVFEMVNCQIITLYSIELVDNNGVKTNKTIDSGDCNNSICIVQFLSALEKSSETYTITVVANSLHMNHNYTFSSMLTLDRKSPISKVYDCDKPLTISCGNSLNENCSITLMKDAPVIIRPGETYSINLKIAITERINSTIITHTLDTKHLCQKHFNYIHIVWSIALTLVLLIAGTIIAYIKVKYCYKRGKNVATESTLSPIPELSPACKAQSEEGLKQDQLYDLPIGRNTKQNEDAIVMQCNLGYSVTSTNI